MERALSILLLMVILLPIFTKTWILLDFKTKQVFIAQTLCIKKEVKDNTCQGQCHLQKQLDLVEEQEQGQLPQKLLKTILEVHLFTEPFSEYAFLHYSSGNINKYASYEVLFSHKSLYSVFHPPKG